MYLLRKVPHILFLAAALCLPPATPGSSISGGDGEPVDLCGNTTTLDCSTNVPGVDCTDGSRWDAAEGQPQTYENSELPIECYTNLNPTKPSCSGSGYVARPPSDPENDCGDL